MADLNALRQQIEQDPRVRTLAQQRMRGSIPGIVTAAELRGLGYDVPGDWKYSSTGGGGRRQSGVFEETDKWDVIIPAAAAGVGGYGAIANAAAGAPAVANAATSSAPVLPSSSIPGLHEAVPGAIASQGISSTVPRLIGETGGGIADFLKNLVGGGNKGPGWSDLVGLAGLIPAAMSAVGGRGGPSAEESALLDEARQGMALQRRRLEQSQPVYDSLIRMAYGGTPTRHRGEAPAGYQAPANDYPYTPPRFGGR